MKRTHDDSAKSKDEEIEQVAAEHLLQLVSTALQHSNFKGTVT
jgi:hypothetical protein